jgi:hypothetical protein
MLAASCHGVCARIPRDGLCELAAPAKFPEHPGGVHQLVRFFWFELAPNRGELIRDNTGTRAITGGQPRPGLEGQGRIQRLRILYRTSELACPTCLGNR